MYDIFVVVEITDAYDVVFVLRNIRFKWVFSVKISDLYDVVLVVEISDLYDVVFVVEISDLYGAFCIDTRCV